MQLTDAIPHLRAFGRSLSGNPDLADDLVQDTLLKAWAARDRFVAGTSMKAWTFVILRNTYFSNMRRKKFTGNYDEIAAERILSAPAPQQDPLHLADLQRALMEISDDQREAVILVGAGGYSYEEAAEIAGCAIGTMKSRVSRARQTLEGILEDGRFTEASAGHDKSTATALENIIEAVAEQAS
ncbi:sigma-70 family RNA polymerase sigma factor [Parasphingorhabdus cellanae]|nr:sigma-70 family RNA polymerase sigma factor [Parasphingorhabdus cellanae]